MLSKLSFARLFGTAAMMLIGLSIIAWSQAMVSAYRCTGMQCHALELPSECDLSACEQFGYPIASVWQPDEQCFSLWGHGRCKVGEGHQHYVSERPFD